MFSGQGKGFDVDLIKLISDAVSIPVIASSGAGAPAHFSEVFNKTNASAALAAGIFHRKEVLLLFHYFLSADWNDFDFLPVFYDVCCELGWF